MRDDEIPREGLIEGARQGANVTEKSLGILAGFVKSWPGEKIGPGKLISLANTGGRKPPLLWVFNGAHEFPALAEALGPDQPLIGMRSLNTVVKIRNLTAWDERILAARYAAELGDSLRGRRFFVGGNCQGAPIAAFLARALLLAGGALQGFVAMEWADLPPLPVPTTLMFGAESPENNPFLKGLDPMPLWRLLHPKLRVIILPGEHGTYFSASRLPNLVAELNAAMGVVAAPLGQRGAAVPVVGMPRLCRAKAELIVAPALPGSLGGDGIVFLWDRHVTALPHRVTARTCLAPAQFGLLRVTAPEEPGLWTLQTHRCRAGEGPVAWAEETLNFHQIEVLDAV